MTILFDIGATHMRLAPSDEEGIGTPTVVDTPPDPQAAIALFVATAQSFGTPYERAVGGVAGSIEEDGTISSATNLPNWNGFAFAAHLAEALGVPVQVRNDAELNGLGEAMVGAGADYRSVAYIGIGTGVGTAHIVDGVIELHSGEGIARQSIITLADGSTLEERIGGRSLERMHGMYPRELDPEVWATLTPYLVEGVLNAIRVWQPEVVVLGGSLMDDADGFRVDEVEQLVRQQSDGLVPAIRAAILGGTSGLEGARIWNTG